MKTIVFLCLLSMSTGFSLGATPELDSVEGKNCMFLPQDDWFSLQLMGTKIGYAHISLENSEYATQHAIRVDTDTVMKLNRGGTAIRLESRRIAYFGADLLPRYFSLSSNESGAEKRVEGVVKDGVVHIKTFLAGVHSRSEEPFPRGTIFEQMISYFLLKEGMYIGAEYQLSVFNLELLSAVQTQVKVLRKETIQYAGNPKSVYMVEYTMNIMGGLTTTAWISGEGTTYRIEFGLKGVPIELTKSNMETALGPAGDVDVILTTKLLAKGKQPTFNATRLKVELRLSNGALNDAIVTDNRQNLITATENGRTGVLEVAMLNLDVERAPSLPLDLSGLDSEVAQFLKPSVYIQADHPAIATKAREILNGETNSWKAAANLCRWVHQSIWNKNLNTGFGSSLQTLESLEGDCTEHTVLMIALARAVGIPARICAGIVFQHDAFYYHFWPEVYVGMWVAMEPTLGQLQADASHIQLAGSTFESDSMFEFGEGVIRTLNQLEIDVLE